jgi:DHA2 family multidrug resistance protein-like MFS transporter
MAPMPPTTNTSRASPREWIGLAVLTLPCLVYSMDLTVLNFAVPQLTRHLKPSAAQLLWIMDIYGFMVAGFLVTMGTLGDRIGRRRLLLIGAATFAAASLLAAFAQSAAQLITARAALGVAGATLAPSTLSLIRNMFHDEVQRRSAIAVWMASFSAGTALGPVTGGLLLEHFWWGSVFLVNVPLMALLVILGLWLLPEFRSEGSEPLDLISAVLSLAAVLLVVFAIKQVAAQGFGAQALIPAVIGTAIGGLFLRRQRGLSHPFVDLSLFTSRGFRAALLVNVGGAFFIAGIYLFVAQYLQLVQGLPPMRAALCSMPSALVFILASAIVPALAPRYSTRQLMTAGLLIAALGFAMLLGVRADGPLWLLIAALMVFSLGFTPVASLTTDHIVSSAPPERAGGAAALSETAFELGAALGIALLGSLGAAIFRARMAQALPPSLDAISAQAASATLGGAVEVVTQQPALAAALLAPAKTAFTNGMLAAAVIGLVCLLAMAVHVNRALR